MKEKTFKTQFDRGVRKFLCRNSYQRRLVHNIAQEHNLMSRSIIDYTQFHVNESITVVRDSHCCPECDTKELTISATPYSFVEIGKGNDKIIIGRENMLPESQSEIFWSMNNWKIRAMKRAFKNRTTTNIILF